MLPILSRMPEEIVFLCEISIREYLGIPVYGTAVTLIISVESGVHKGCSQSKGKMPRKTDSLYIANAGLNACQNIKVPDNINLIRIPPYNPELNPAEKVWQWMKD